MASIGISNPFGSLSDHGSTGRPQKGKRRGQASTSKKPVVARTESVQMLDRVRLPETEGFKYVQRHTAPKDLIQADEISSLVHSLGGNATISPCGSACSDTDRECRRQLRRIDRPHEERNHR